MTGLASLFEFFFHLQYGRILDIELKIPPRPPCYCFVEVHHNSLHSTKLYYGIGNAYSHCDILGECVSFMNSLRPLEMPKMQLGVVMDTILMAVVYG